MLLQERINELGSGILHIKEDKVEVIGFMSEERLLDYYDKNINCIFSFGIYDYEDLIFDNTIDDSLFIILKDNIEQARYQFKKIKKSKVKFKSIENKQLNRVYTVRYCKYSDKYSFIDKDSKTTFNTLEEVKDFFYKKYNTELIIP